MHTTRLWLTVFGFFLVLPQTGVCAELVVSARSSVQPYIDWLPPDTETLVVLKQPYRMPVSPDLDSKSLDTIWREIYLARMFSGAARSALVGKQIRLWIEGSCRFRLPHVPDVSEEIPTTG